MTKSQNTKNEQQKDLCITSEQLTEQWKQGKLPEGWYYVKGNRAEGIYAYTAEYLNNMYRPINGERIIEQVPSYEQWQKHRKTLLKTQEKNCDIEIINAQLKERNDSLNNRDINLCRIANGIRDENFALKELLKECFEYIDWTDGTGSPISQQKLLDKIDEALK